MAVDDHARIAFTAMHPDERTASAVQFLREAVAYYARLGITVRRLLTDNGSAFRSRDFGQACRELGIRHKFTRAYRPPTNGKAEPFIQSALREWAYGSTYQTSAQRIHALLSWQHHYNWHRPHAGIRRRCTHEPTSKAVEKQPLDGRFTSSAREPPPEALTCSLKGTGLHRAHCISFLLKFVALGQFRDEGQPDHPALRLRDLPALANCRRRSCPRREGAFLLLGRSLDMEGNSCPRPSECTPTVRHQRSQSGD